jgi:hypothetical protein
MKFLNLFKKEIKTKWSTRLLVGVFVFTLCSSFASIVLLKQEYDKQKNTISTPLKGFNQALNQAFKHIKVDECFYTHIMFDTSKQFAVYIDEKSKKEAKWFKSIYIQNDTLFIKSINKDVDVFSNSVTGKSNFEDKPIHIYAPEIETITVSQGHFDINSLNQKSITLNLSKTTYFMIKNTFQDLDVLKVSMTDNSSLTLDRYKPSKGIHIQNLEATLLTKDCALNLGDAYIQNFKLNGTAKSRIELSSEMVNHLMNK